MKNIAVVIKNGRIYNFNLLKYGENKGRWYQNGYIVDKNQLDDGSHGSVKYFEYRDEADNYINGKRV